MKTRWQELRSRHWNNRPASERKVIAAACILLFPVIYYYLLWQPAHQAVSKLHKALPTLQAQATKMQEQASEVDAIRHRPELAALDAQALKSSIEESAVRHQLRASITTLDAQEPNATRITCEVISFATWITWLHELEQEQHIRADSISITALAQAGMVKISATLSNGNSQ
jgi:type II secretory pathway component PulM